MAKTNKSYPLNFVPVQRYTRTTVHLTAKPSELLDVLRLDPPTDWRAGNEYQLHDVIFNSKRDKFCGGTFEELFEPHRDFSDFDFYRNTLSQTNLLKNMTEAFGSVTKRVRTRSAYDGEYDFDKRWEIQPFMHRQKSVTQGRMINLNVHCNFNCHVDAKDIARFAALLSAIITLMESSGVMVNLDLFMSTDRIDTKSDIDFRVKIPVKASNEYLAPGLLLKVMGPNFYRRAYFHAVIMAAQAHKANVRDNLGYPEIHYKVWNVDLKNNTVTLYSEPKGKDQDKFFTEVVSMLARID